MNKLCVMLFAGAWAFCVRAQTNLPAPAGATGQISAQSSQTATNPPVVLHSPAEMLVLITADHWRGYGNSNSCVWYGQVHLNDAPQMDLTCATFTVELPKIPSGTFQRATAETNVVIDFLKDGLTNHATADKLVYTYSVSNFISDSVTNSLTNNLVVLSGNVTITNAQFFMQGDPIIWDRLHDVIDSPNPTTMKYRPTGTNRPDFFGPPGSSKTNSVQK